MRGQLAPDLEIARRAAAQGGVISRDQLRGLGLSPAAIDRRAGAGALHRLHRGVYAVGHTALGPDGRRWAAVLACGDGACLGHASAAAAFDLLGGTGATMHVVVRGRTGRARRPDLRVHRPQSLADDEVTVLRGLPITTPPRTLLDLAAGGMHRRALARLVDRADLMRLLDFTELQRVLDRHAGRPGAPALTAVLTEYAGSADVRSHLERLVLELCDSSGLPRPQVNVVIEGSVRDFSWPSRRVVVEADGYTWHRSPGALNADRERDVALTLAGWRVLRFTHAQVTRRRAYVTRALSTVLRAT